MQEPQMMPYLHHIHAYVGNSLQSACFFERVLGFKRVGQKLLSKDNTAIVSYAVQQGQALILLTSAVSPSHPVSQYVTMHGDSIQDMAWRVQDPDKPTSLTPQQPPLAWLGHRLENHVKSFKLYGDTTHTLISHLGDGIEVLGYEPLLSSSAPSLDVGIQGIDHLAINLEQGTLSQWERFYHEHFDFITIHDEAVETGRSGMVSKVVASRSHHIVLPLVAPMPDKPGLSQNQLFIEAHQGPGVQHIAFAVQDVVHTVQQLKERGLGFLPVPPTYYQARQQAFPEKAQLLQQFEPLGILLDKDDSGYLYQVFTQPMGPRPTLFLEFIQRDGAQGFGGGNIKALFEAVEREQQARGQV